MARSTQRLAGYLFVLPALIYMLFFVGYPIFDNFRLSLYDVNVMNVSQGTQPFVGMDNYKELFGEGILGTALINTLIYTVACIVLQFVIGLAFAMFFAKPFRMAQRLRGIVMISWLLPATITAMMFKFMFSTNGGIINELLTKFHIPGSPVEWLVTPVPAMFALVLANTWIGIPFNMILLTTGLTTIPKDIYESASIDGAGAFQRFFRITLPLLKPAILSLLVLGFIYTFKVFELVLIMTHGGPVNATQMMSTYAYKLSFDEFNFSLGAATSNVMFLVLFVVGFLYLRLVHKEEVSGS
ncbi:carbohydrate ABC transporter permease [Cohnella lupini]|uniref:Carbohydrate ABC transporter membrane protein 1 (CUT1 family) n=1 Tax=Cohnella lupini TaxID=1294267 RepID=A0A3D9ISS2_9BACL|nr:sugar ABC transporter permease [Cohnella lupini]RED64820.1 carbohydrate ABC transporter membrane protein 1 (CUT1 family) [Cohnella lupini]